MTRLLNLMGRRKERTLVGNIIQAVRVCRTEAANRLTRTCDIYVLCANNITPFSSHTQS